jgi:hypothetical protein
MTTPPEVPVPDNGEDSAPPRSESAPGVEIGASEEGSTFEPEEDQEAHG